MKLLSILFLSLSSFGQTPTAAPDTVSKDEKIQIFENNGMEYAAQLVLNMDGSQEDEKRSQKTEALNFRIREKGIKKIEAHLRKTKEPNLRQNLLFRLSQLYEQQAEVISRRTDIKEKESLIQLSLRNSNKSLESLRKEFPRFMPDGTLFSLAENYSKLKEPQKAENYYREVIQKFPKSSVVADSLLSLGNLYFERQAFLTARSFYQKILVTDELKLFPYAHYKMAWCYFNESDFPAAIARLEQSIFESRKLQQNGDKKLGVEEEALSDLVLFFAEYGSPNEAKEYFEKLVGKEKANELRYQLARRLFEHGKHYVAKDVAKQLLDENPQKEFVNKLYLILISVAERTKDREFGLKTTQKLAKWLKDEKSEQKPEAIPDPSRIESEEYMRLYSQKLHHEAETLKSKEVWGQAKKSYEIYLDTFPNETETPEVKFRYAVLLLNQKEEVKAYQSVTDALQKMDSKHPRFKEALRIRIQSVELASADQKKQIGEENLLNAYDAYANQYPLEELGIEAKFKAASLAKGLESPEQVAKRFRNIAETHPQHALAKASIGEALAVLVKAQKWEALGSESKALGEHKEIHSNLQNMDAEIVKKIAEARELSLVKVTESLENSGKYEEAKNQYEKILSESPSETLGVYSLARLADLSEKKLNKNLDAIDYLTQIKERFPISKEAHQASLELARLYEKVNEPERSVAKYLEFAKTEQGKLEKQALTNAAVILENLGEREQAAEVFFTLWDRMKRSKSPEKETVAALEAACNNTLLSSHKNKDIKILAKIQECSRQMIGMGIQPILWQARAAWAMDQSANRLQADSSWRSLATKNFKTTTESERAYVAMAKLRHLTSLLEDFKKIQFTKTNEKPEANIGKKTKALENLEALAETIIKSGTPKQIISAKNILKHGYLNFADTMETSAMPSRLNDQDKEELKKNFLVFANEFKDRAKKLETVDAQETDRNLASDAPNPSKSDNLDLNISSLSSEEQKMLENGSFPETKASELYAKKSFALYQKGKFGQARYFLEKWKKHEASSMGSASPYGAEAQGRLQSALLNKLPETDPVGLDF